MTKKSNDKHKDNIVEISAALGWIIGSAIWFWIYFPKDDLAFDKMILYMFIGLFAGGLLGELFKYFKNGKIKIKRNPINSK